MNKKILFLMAVLIFLPVLQVSAAQVYVGVKIGNTENPDGEVFDLLPNTQLSILNVSGSTITTTEDTEMGDTLWTPLIDLTNGNQYTAQLVVPFCFDPGEYDSRGPYCWFKGDANQNCNEVCSSNNTTILPDSNCIESDPDCIMLAAFFGSIDNCRSGDPAPSLFTGWGYDTFWWGGTGGGDWCSYKTSSYQRICTCQFDTGTFNFPFTASF